MSTAISRCCAPVATLAKAQGRTSSCSPICGLTESCESEDSGAWLLLYIFPIAICSPLKPSDRDSPKPATRAERPSEVYDDTIRPLPFLRQRDCRGAGVRELAPWDGNAWDVDWIDYR